MVYWNLLNQLTVFPVYQKAHQDHQVGMTPVFRVEDVRIWQLGEDFGTLKAQFTNLRRALEGRVICFKDMPQLTLETYFGG